MTWLSTQATWIDASAWGFGFAANWLVQSTLLVSVGLLVGRLLRGQGSAAQSVVYRTTLAAALICPIATFALSQAGFSGWSIAMPQARVAQASEPLPLEATVPPIEAAAEPPLPEFATPVPAEIELFTPAFPTGIAGPVPETTGASPEPPVVATVEPIHEPTPVQEAPPVVATTGPAATGFGKAAVAAVLVWVMVAAFLVARLALAWRQLARLRRHATPADEFTENACVRLSRAMGVPAPAIRCSPYLPSPCLAGIRKPTVLLPETEPNLPLRDVLIHELAHLSRHDCLWNLLRQTATALFFFQPMLWLLSKRIEATAEEVCDDFVVQFGGDREEYAHRLVNIAELSTSPIAAAGVGVVSLRSMLAQRVTRILDTSRSLSTRVGNLLLLAVLVCGGVGATMTGLIGLAPAAAEAEANDVTVEAAEEEAADDDLITVRGRVVKPDGQPAGGVDVYVLRWFWNYGDKKPLSAAKADADGRFEISYRKSQFAETAGRPNQWREAFIAAFDEGYGPGWVHYNRLKPGEDATVRLAVDDVPIEGRVIDLEGNPVAGVRVEVGAIDEPKAGTLDDYLEAIKAAQAVSTAYRVMSGGVPQHTAKHWPEVTTNSNGRFRLSGIGRERLVKLHVSGPTVVTQTLRVVTRRVDPVVHPAYAYKDADTVTQYGAEFEYTAAPSRVITGVVRDADSGEPVAGAEIWSWRFAGESIGGITSIKTKSDAEGRYRLEGMPKGKGNEIVVVPTDLPYFTAEFEIPDPAGIDPVSFDIGLHRGQWVSGRVTDKATSRPVAAQVFYMAFPDNELTHELPEFQYGKHCSSVQDRYRTDLDGRYRVVALPGHGVVGVKAILDPYPGGQGYDKIEGADDRQAFGRVNGAINPSERWPTAMKEVRISEGTESSVLDFSLDAGSRVTLRTRDPSGDPIDGVEVTGVTEIYGAHQKMESAEFDLVCFRPGENRTVLLSHPERRLGKALRITQDDARQGPVEVTLAPMATVTGRLIKDEVPVAGVSLRVDVDGDSHYGRQLSRATTDKEGRFEHTELLPGLNYTLLAEGRGIDFTTVTKSITVAPGETIDLGVIDVTTKERPEPVRTVAAAVTKKTPSEWPMVTMRGKVVDDSGEPVPGARVAAQQSRWLGASRGNSEHRLLGEVTADERGEFEIEVPKLDHNDPVWKQRFAGARWGAADLVATAPGHCLAWERSNNGRYDREVVLRMPKKAVPIEGRLIGLEGQPLAGLRVRVQSVSTAEPERIQKWIADVASLAAEDKLPKPSSEMVLSSFMASTAAPMPEGDPAKVRSAYYPIREILTGLPGAFSSEFETDAAGRFSIGGLPPNQLVALQIEGGGVEQQRLEVVTRAMDPLHLTNTSYYGARFDYAVSPGVTVVGTVTDAESGEPLVGATVMSELDGSTRMSIEGRIQSRTDGEGRFRIEGMPPGSGSELKVVPSADQPYLVTDGLVVPESDGAEPVEMPIELRRGVFLTGRVIDRETGEPVQATLHHHPMLDNPKAGEYQRYRGPDMWRHDDRSYRTGEDGSFRVAAPPGPGILAAQVLERGSYCVGVGADEIEGLIERERRFATYDYCSPRIYNTLVQVDIPAGADSFTQDVRVSRGGTLQIKAVDPAGNQLTGVRCSGRTPLSGAFPESPTEDLIEVIALRAGERRPLHLLHAERRLGLIHTAEAPGGAGEVETQTVTLAPCATVTGRVVDSEGEPLAGITFHASLLPSQDFGITAENAVTDSDGRFTFKHLAKGGSYRIGGSKPGGNWVGLIDGLEVQAGETIDLGVIDASSDERPEPVRTAANKAVRADLPAPKPNVSEFTGKVVTPDGEPAVGAKLFLVFHVPESSGRLTPKWEPLATTDAEGAFRFSVSPGDFGPIASPQEFGFGMIVASHKDFGYAVRAASLFEASGAALQKLRERMKTVPAPYAEQVKKMLGSRGDPLRLVPAEHSLRGRILDIEGQPVVGARLTVLRTYESFDNSLEAWREAALAPKADFYSARMKTEQVMNGPMLRSVVEPAVTDADGVFTMSGVGDGRIVQLLLEGPGIESAKVFARTEPGEPIKLMRERRSPDLGFYTYHPAEFTHVAGPSVPITGVVRDAETKEPLSGITVKSQRRHGELIGGWGQDFVRTVTDQGGRYRLEGMPIGKENAIAAIAPRGDIAYFSVEKPSPTETGKPTRVDFELLRGVWVEGRVTDKQTGEGLPGRLEYFVPQSSPNYRAARSLGVDERDRLRSDGEGRYRIAALPGPGYVTFMADNHPIYPRAKGILKKDGTVVKAGSMIRASPRYLTPGNSHVVAEVNPDERAERVELNLQLDRGATATGRAVDPAGKPVTDYYHTGRLANFTDVWRPSEADQFELVSYDSKQPRHVYFVQQERQLAGHLVIQGELPEDLVVRLQPAGKVTGRLVDKDGDPLPNCQLTRYFPPTASPAERKVDANAAPLPHNVAHSSSAQYETDAEGRFAIAGLVPGVEYGVRATDGSIMASRRPPKFSGPLDAVIQIGPGESKDLGDVRLLDEKEFAARAKQAATAPSEGASEPRARVISGKVTLPNGEPAAGAHVAMVALRFAGSRQTRGEVLGQGVVGDGGRFTLPMPEKVTSKTHGYANLLVRTDESAIAWQKLNLDEAEAFDIRLPTERPIAGRLVDIEGQPAAGVKLVVQSVMKRSDGAKPSRDGIGFRDSNPPKAWLTAVVSDADGRFQLRGVPEDCGVYLRTEGNDRFARQDLALNTGMPEQRGPRDATYRALTKNGDRDEELLLTLSPAQVFEGTVTYEDTGEPAPNARLSIWASQQEFAGSMLSVEGFADEKGVYRISPSQGVRFGVTAFPPNGTPYLPRRTPLDKSIRWREGDTTRKIDRALPRGVLIKGVVTESGSGEPVSGAIVQYEPEAFNNPNTADDILTGWQATQVSDAEGRFAIAVLPGPGRLLIQEESGRFVTLTVTEREINRNQKGGRRNYLQSAVRIDPQPGDEPLGVKIELERCAPVNGRIIDKQGVSVDDALVISQHNRMPRSLTWRGQVLPTLGGRFSVAGLKAGEETPVHVLDPTRRLGATVFVKGGEDIEAVLEPCGEAIARVLDQDGEPRSGIELSPLLIITPGAGSYDFEAAQQGETLSDSDSVANIDRKNYWPGPKTDKQGRITLPALIPGALYRLNTFIDGKEKTLAEFKVKPGERVELGDLTLNLDD